MLFGKSVSCICIYLQISSYPESDTLKIKRKYDITLEMPGNTTVPQLIVVADLQRRGLEGLGSPLILGKKEEITGGRKAVDRRHLQDRAENTGCHLLHVLFSVKYKLTNVEVNVFSSFVSYRCDFCLANNHESKLRFLSYSHV